MKSDLIKLIVLIWMTITVFFIYEMWQDLNYLTELIHAYISMAVEMVRQ